MQTIGQFVDGTHSSIGNITGPSATSVLQSNLMNDKNFMGALKAKGIDITDSMAVENEVNTVVLMSSQANWGNHDAIGSLEQYLNGLNYGRR